MGTLRRVSQHAPRLAEHVSDRGPLSPDDAALLMLPVAETLASAHATTGVHGAVSPAAVLMDEGALPTLLDASLVDADPGFTAPEVAAGARPDARADVWSFGGLLLHATSGRPPTTGLVRPRDGGWLRPIIELALLPDPDDRPSMADVAAYLRARVAPEKSGQEEVAARPVLGVAMALVGAAVVVLLAVVGAVLLLGDRDGDDRAAADRSGVASSPSTSMSSVDAPSTPEEPQSTAPPEPPSARALEQFARAYIRTASSDPSSGYKRLTRSYRQASPRYHEVWSAIEDPEILAVSADPDRLTVSYTYRYTLPDGEQRTEDVTLRLVQHDGRLLIAGASARPL